MHKKDDRFDIHADLEAFSSKNTETNRVGSNTLLNQGMNTRIQVEQYIDLTGLYEEILMSKIFEKFIAYIEKSHFQTAKIIEYERNGQKIIINRILFNSNDAKFHLISFFEDEERKTEYKIYNQISDFKFEYFQLTNDHRTILAGNREFIMLWNCEEDIYLDGYKIPFCSLIDIDEVKNGGNIKDFTAYNTDNCIEIYYTVGKFVFNIKIRVEVEDTQTLSVTSAYCKLDEEPRFFYLNIEEMLIAVVTSEKDLDSQQEYIHKIIIINQENMAIIDQLVVEKNYFDDIYFKMLGNSSSMNLKIIRKLNNRLYLRNVSINATDEKQSNNLSVIFSAETSIMPEFFSKNSVSNIENSILNSLLITYKTNELRALDVHSLIDYSLTNEIKNIYCYGSKDYNRYESFLSIGPTCISDKLMFKGEGDYLVIYSLSELKILPRLECHRLIEKINFVSPFLFIIYKGMSLDCYKILLTSKGTVSPRLTISEIEYIHQMFPENKKKKIIETLCAAKDAINLKFYLNWKINNLTPENFEQLPLKLTLNENNHSCTEILLQHILQISDDFPKIKLIYDEIENVFPEILTSACMSVPDLLNKLFSINLEYGSLKSDSLPLYKTYDFRGSSIRGYFFGRSTNNRKDYQVKNSLIRVPDCLGSPASLQLSKSLCEVEDLRIFGTEFIRTFIRLKWNNLKFSIFGLTLLMWLNIVLVTFLVNKDSNPWYLYLFVFINALLLLSELIQAANLGVEIYIGIKEIKYFSILQLIISCCFVFLYPDYYFAALFVLAQALSITRIMKVTSFCGLEYMLFSTIPALGLLAIYFFTSEPFYYFIIVGAIEMLIFIGSYLGPVLLIGLRFGFMCFSITLFVCLPTANLYLLVLNLILLGCETIYYLKMRNLNEDLKTERFYNFICFFIAEILVVLSFVFENMLCGYISLAILVSYSLYRFPVIQYCDDAEARMKFFDFLCFRFCVYLLFAFLLTKYESFLYSFLFCNLLEFFLQREMCIREFYNDFLKLIFNKNTMDIIRYIISAVWIIKFKLLEVTSSNQNNNERQDLYLTWFFVLLNLINAVLGFRAFDQTRFFVRLILRCIVEIIPFLMIFLFFTFGFGLLNVVSKSKLDFEVIWKNPFDQSVGGFTHEPDEDIIEYTMFTLGTFLIIIIMLNLLISVLGNIFENFLNEAKLIDFKVMIETIYEVEVLIFWRRMNNSVKFFASCENVILGMQEDSSILEEKIETIASQIEETRNDFNTRLEKFEMMIEKNK
jgi:hypothetical protein